MTNGEHFGGALCQACKMSSARVFLCRPSCRRQPFLPFVAARPAKKEKQRSEEVTFTELEFICIPALPSPRVGFYELAQAKH